MECRRSAGVQPDEHEGNKRESHKPTERVSTDSIVRKERSMTRRMLAFLLALFTLWLNVDASAQAAGIASQNSALAAADQLFAAGKTAEAAAKYQAIVKADPSVVPAQIGLIRTFLIEQKLDEALSAANSALAVQPNAPLLLTTMGDLQFRLGQNTCRRKMIHQGPEPQPERPGSRSRSGASVSLLFALRPCLR